jgi:hypothetical protein
MAIRASNATPCAAQRTLSRMFSAVSRTSLLMLALITGCARAPQPSNSASAAGAWIEFQGTWTAAGNRNGIGLGADRRATIATLDGSLVLAGRSRPGVGFRSEAIVFNDSATGMVGRAVWTDEHGDRVFSELRGEGTANSNKILGTFINGTGRYSGVAGTYEFSWRFLVENEDGMIQGQSVGLQGRVRLDSQRARANEGAPGS